VAAQAQQGDRMRRIGVLLPGDESDLLRKTDASALKRAHAANTEKQKQGEQ